MMIRAKIHKPMYDHNDKKYIQLAVPSKFASRVEQVHEANAGKLHNGEKQNPLMGSVLTVKVPYRYRRVMCQVVGSKPIQALREGDEVVVELEFTGAWNVGNTSGFSWKIKNVDTL